MAATTSTGKKRTQYFLSWRIFGWLVSITINRPLPPQKKRKRPSTGRPPGRPRKVRPEPSPLPPPGEPLPMK